MNRVAWGSIIVALLLAVVAKFLWQRELDAKNLVLARAFEAEIAQRTSSYIADNQAILMEFENSLPLVGASDFQQARNRITPTVKSLTGFGTTSKLCYKMAKDIMFDSFDTQAALESLIVPNIIVPCENGNAKINSELNIFMLKLAKNHHSYCADLALAINNSSIYDANSKAREQFLQANSQGLTKAKNIALEKAFIVSGLTLEACFINSSLKALTTTCSRVVSTLVTSSSTAGVASVADGPLPVGDAIGAVCFVGGVAWSSYEIYQVQRVLPAKLSYSLKTAVSTYETNARAEAIRVAREAVNNYNLGD